MKDIRMNKILTLIIIVQWAPLIRSPSVPGKVDPTTGGSHNWHIYFRSPYDLNKHNVYGYHCNP